LVNTAPFGDGWFFQVKLANPGDVEQLLAPDAYRAQIGA
jgi:glycine cleavage system H lipoate-binding protein